MTNEMHEPIVVITLPQLTTFLQRPGINIRGICKEAKVSQQYLQRSLRAGTLPGKKALDKLLPVMRSYGF